MVVLPVARPLWPKDCTAQLEMTAGISSQTRADDTPTAPELNVVQDSAVALRRLDSMEVCETTARVAHPGFCGRHISAPRTEGLAGSPGGLDISQTPSLIQPTHVRRDRSDGRIRRAYGRFGQSVTALPQYARLLARGAPLDPLPSRSIQSPSPPPSSLRESA